MKSSSSSFISPIILGGLMSFFFYGAIHKGLIHQPLVLRYFAGHPIEYITTIMFFIGTAILAVKFVHILLQRQQLRQSPILTPHQQPVAVSCVNIDIEHVRKYEKDNGGSPLTERLKTLLHSLRRGGSASNLDTELRNLAEDAAVKADADYGLVRLILWAVPMLGFLGTVIGITVALDNLDLNMINESSQKLSAGLAVAFDTTGLAIALDIILFFLQFVVYREETNLLTETDQLTDAELRGRFEVNHEKDDDPIQTVKRMLESVIGSIEHLTANQTTVWEKCMTIANQRYAELTAQSGETLKMSLAAALNENLEHHAKHLAHAESELLAQTGETVIQFNEVLQKNAAGLLSLQEETARQTETVREVLGTNSQLIQLEDRLRENLSVLAHVGNFEETINSLAAAIHLLNSNRRSELKVG